MRKTIWQALEPESVRGRIALFVGMLTVLVAIVTATGIWFNATKTTPNDSSNTESATIGTMGIINHGSQIIEGSVNIGGGQTSKSGAQNAAKPE
jgi:hypothetical protein